jgi:hypothetical protein
MVKHTIEKGRTTQADIVEIFGPPDLVTRRNDMDVWTYDKTRYEVQSSSGYLTVIVAGIGGEKTQSSSTSTMLIVYFDGNDVVSDYKLSVVRF